MGKIINFPGDAPITGEFAFVQCNCGATEEGFEIIAIADPEKPAVAAILCRGCGKERDVVGGIIHATVEA